MLASNQANLYKHGVRAAKLPSVSWLAAEAQIMGGFASLQAS